MKARDIMTSNPDVVTLDDTIERAAQVMRDRDVGIVPVVDSRQNMRLRGLITDRDIAIRHVAEGHEANCRVEQEMTSRQLDTVRPDSDVDEVLEIMKRDQVRRVPVVDEDDRLVGIIAQADLATEGVENRRVGEVVEQISQPGGSRH